MGMATISGKVHERFRHKGGAQPVLPSQLPYHEFKENMSIGGGERVVIGPVHFELTVCILVITLIRPPAEPKHCVADCADQLIVPQQSCLVVARLCLAVPVVADRRPVRAQYEKLSLDA